MNGAEFGERRRQHAVHRVAVGRLGHHDFDFAAQALDFHELPQNARGLGRRVRKLEEIIPLCFLGKGRPTCEHKTGSARLAKWRATASPMPPGASGNQIDSTFAQSVRTGSVVMVSDLPRRRERYRE